MTSSFTTHLTRISHTWDARTWKSKKPWARWRRVRVMRQRDGDESGVVCLAMLLAYFGKARTLAQCRVACASDREGITSEHLVDAARKLGMKADDWVVQGADAFDIFRLPLPAIVYWQDRRFVVVERITHRHVTIVDPALGRRRLMRSVFDRCCSGVAVTLARALESGVSEAVNSSASAASKSRGWCGLGRNSIREALRTPEARWMTGLLIVSTVALQICRLALPVGTLLVVEHVVGGIEPSLFWIGTAAVLVLLAHVILRLVQGQAVARLGTIVEARWGYEVLSRVVALPLRVFDRRVAGDLLVSVGGVDARPRDLASQSIVACIDGWFVIFSLFLIAMWSPVLAALAGGFGLLQVGVAAWAGRRLWIGVEREVAADAETRACLMEMWRGLSDLKTAGREAYAIERWSGFAARGLEMSEARQRFGLMVETLGSGMAWCSLLGLLVLGAHEVMAGGLTMAAMLALIVLAAGALMPLGEVSRSLQRFLIARARFETLRDVLDAADVSEVPATRADERVAPEMLMRGDRQREGWR